MIFKFTIQIFALLFFIPALNTQAQNSYELSSDSVAILLQQTTRNLPAFIRELGVSGNPNHIDPLREFIESNRSLAGTIKWNSLLALARLGDNNALNIVLEKVKKAGVNDDVVDALFPDLIYTQQRRAFDYLVSVLYSDDANCQSPDPESSSTMNCACRVIEMLAPIIKDFPLKVEPGGDLATDNYLSALITVRDWFKLHPRYEIVPLFN